jgi:hypothetical protein
MTQAFNVTAVRVLFRQVAFINYCIGEPSIGWQNCVIIMGLSKSSGGCNSPPDDNLGGPTRKTSGFVPGILHDNLAGNAGGIAVSDGCMEYRKVGHHY